MLYKKKLISGKIIRLRGKHKPLNCDCCDVTIDSCNGINVCIYKWKDKPCLFLATRMSLCTLLKRSLYYYAIEKETGNKTTIEYSIF